MVLFIYLCKNIPFRCYGAHPFWGELAGDHRENLLLKVVLVTPSIGNHFVYRLDSLISITEVFNPQATDLYWSLAC